LSIRRLNLRELKLCLNDNHGRVTGGILSDSASVAGKSVEIVYFDTRPFRLADRRVNTDEELVG
jgi:hypothetical protein